MTNTTTKEDLYKIVFDFSTGEYDKPHSEIIDAQEVLETTGATLISAIQTGATTELTLYRKARSTAEEDAKQSEDIIIDFDSVVMAIPLGEAEVKTGDSDE